MIYDIILQIKTANSKLTTRWHPCIHYIDLFCSGSWHKIAIKRDWLSHG